MPAKSITPEAAQKKVWAAEIKTRLRSIRKVKADFRNEQKRLIAESLAAHKAVVKFHARAEKQLPKMIAAEETRIAILKGRLGI
jgi:hypothetical protein